MAEPNYNRKLSEDSKEVRALEDLMSLLDIPRFRRNLREVLFQYMMTNYDCFMGDFKDFIEDMKFVFSFLDVLNEETDQL